MDELSSLVVAAIQRVLPDTPRIDRRQRLVAELGLESMQLARVVARLDAQLDCEPFAELVAITDIDTVGDLIDAYDRALRVRRGEAAPATRADAAEGAARGAKRRGVRR
jgi:acyl carrier protein